MKRYRQNVHIVPLVVWALLCVGVSIFLFHHSKHIMDRHWHDNELAAGVALLIFGPVALVLYILRSRLMWVAIVPEGVLVAGRRVILWSAIEGVERKKPILRGKGGPVEMPDTKSLNVGNGCFDAGCFAGGGEIGGLILGIVALVAAVLFIWLIFFVFVPLIVVPVIEIFAPVGERIRIVASPRGVLLRDLRNADEFLREIGSRVPIKEI